MAVITKRSLYVMSLFLLCSLKSEVQIISGFSLILFDSFYDCDTIPE